MNSIWFISFGIIFFYLIIVCHIFKGLIVDLRNVTDSKLNFIILLFFFLTIIISIPLSLILAIHDILIYI